MNQSKAKQIAKHLLKKGSSCYAGRYTIAMLLSVDIKKLTPVATQKIQRALYEEAIEQNKRPVIELLYAEEQLRI